MAKVLGKGGKVYFDPAATFTGPAAGDDPTAASVSALADSDVQIGGVTGYSISQSGDTVDLTDMDSDTREYEVATPSITVTLNLFRDDDDDANQDGFYIHDGGSSTGVGVGQKGALIIRPDGTGSGKTQLSGMAVVNSVDNSSEFASGQTRTVTLMVNEQWVETTQS